MRVQPVWAFFSLWILNNTSVLPIFSPNQKAVFGLLVVYVLLLLFFGKIKFLFHEDSYI